MPLHDDGADVERGEAWILKQLVLAALDVDLEDVYPALEQQREDVGDLYGQPFAGLSER